MSERTEVLGEVRSFDNTLELAHLLAIIESASISHGCPAKCTGTSARVLGVTNRSTVFSSMVYVSGRMSEKTGFTPAATSIFAVAANVFGVVTASSPFLSPAAR